MPAPLSLASLNHVARITKRLVESRRFYVEVLGFREISRPPFSFNGAWLYGAGMQIHLIEDAAAPEPGPLHTRVNHIAFSVTEIDEMERRLQAWGVSYHRQEIPGRGYPQIFFLDPDGHLIEVGVYGTIDQ